jgi:dephospho-CoA kinase
MILGVTGTLSAGKDQLAAYLQSKGFKHFSLSDMIREDLRSKNHEITRDSLRKRGNELRQEHGFGILGELAAKKVAHEANKNFVITSIRHPDEANALMKLPNFHLLSLDAPIEIRFKRAYERNREKENIPTLEDFRRSEAVEITSPDPASQQLTATMALARYNIINNGTLEELNMKIDALIEKLSNN